MKINILYVILLLCILFSAFYYFFERKVKFVEVEKISTKKIVSGPLWLLTKYDSTEIAVLKSEFGFPEPAIQHISQLIEERKVDFKTSDYLISPGRKLSNLKNSPYLFNVGDDCPDKAGEIIFPEFKSEAESYIYIYKLQEKNKYRTPCP